MGHSAKRGAIKNIETTNINKPEKELEILQIEFS